MERLLGGLERHLSHDMVAPITQPPPEPHHRGIVAAGPSRP
jgi:hypothetical protein